MSEEKWKELETKLMHADSRIQAENMVRRLKLEDVNQLAIYLEVGRTTSRAQKIVRIVDVTFESSRRSEFLRNYRGVTK